MCGIVGFVGTGSDAVLSHMRDRLTHRGPNAAGSFRDDDVWLAHRRLSIIDLEGGGQPMANAGGDLVLVFNGEIYNHLQLRERFGPNTFRSRCDSEVILRAYEAAGTQCVADLDGMFAFVIYDRTRRRLFGARDRMGKKPLYHTTRPLKSTGTSVAFAFASEIKALRAHPTVESSLRLSEEGLLSYLLMDYTTHGLSCFDGISNLLPGHAFTFDLDAEPSQRFRTWKYWDLQATLATTTNAPSMPEAGRRIHALLSDAVEKRLMADVPLGVLLSGGIDSSAVLAFMQQHLATDQIQTFSIGFDEPSFDESMHAAAVAHHFGTRHHHRRFTAETLRLRLPALVELLDEPFADPSILPVALLSQFAREHVTVALGGDGGDELFAGYDPFLAVGPARHYRRWIPRWCHDGVFQRAAHLFPVSSRNMSIGFRVERFLRGAPAPANLRCAVWMAPFTVAQLRWLAPDLVGDDTEEAVYARFMGDVAPLGDGASDLRHAIHFFEHHYLAHDILTKVDRASMMHSLEVRCPFLDTALVEYVNALPDTYKLRGRHTKFILKQLLSGAYGHGSMLPQPIIRRKKKGFGIPLARWIRVDLHDSFREVLINEWPQSLDRFDTHRIRLLFESHVDGRRNHAKELWALFVLAVWVRRHLSS